MEETTIATFDNVKFIEGVTKLTQNNWQEYFGSLFPNGAIKGLCSPNSSSGVYNQISDGIAIANGIIAKLETEQEYTSIQIPAGVYDCFACLRIHFTDELAELVVKRNIADTESTVQFMKELMQFTKDESYYCERNSDYYEIPLYYVSASYYRYISRYIKDEDNYKKSYFSMLPLYLIRNNTIIRRSLVNLNDILFFMFDNMFPANNTTILLDSTKDGSLVCLSERLFVEGLNSSWLSNYTNLVWPRTARFVFSNPSNWTYGQQPIRNNTSATSNVTDYFHYRTLNNNEQLRLHIYKTSVTDNESDYYITYYVEEF